jgi:hypothetical protein
MQDHSPVAVWRAVEAAAAVLVLGFFLYASRSVLNPLILFGLLWAVLLPFRHRQGYAPLLTVTGVVTLVWLLASTGSLLAPFLLSVLVAYILDPAVDTLERRRVGRTLAIMLLAVPALALLALVVLLVLPAAIQQLGEVARMAPVFLDRLAGWLEAGRERLLLVDVPLIDEEDLLLRLQSVDAQSVVAFLEERRIFRLVNTMREKCVDIATSCVRRT